MARNVVQFQKGLSEPAFEQQYGSEGRCCRGAVEVTPISTKAMYQVTRIESGFPTLIMRFSALTAIATSPC